MKTNISLAEKWIVSIYIDIIQEVFQIPKTEFKDLKILKDIKEDIIKWI